MIIQGIFYTSFFFYKYVIFRASNHILYYLEPSFAKGLGLAIKHFKKNHKIYIGRVKREKRT